ncbi:outer membrane lipoprotein carrier protein LolA [Flavobacterium sp. NKUCC04_CG]|uniref:LolA family protein n=1 Tax=Flavobacterium sp. NKUCC04_CG TaxID=2842121 RepID=UPI001C5AE47B|nr:outer membrane lipoprotein carrier protein LolA [Flavobacterium sp. NKUCC04_CG]MBW3518641.1 outer membrane lipoprotein carrier protein LolA [Flavobacterium sp. NKUCC04_CG]
MKNLFTCLLLSLCVFQAQAQNSAKAKALLDEVSTKIKSYNNIVIDFNYSVRNNQNNSNQDSKGNLTVQKDLYEFNFMGMTKLFDGNKIYTIIPEDEEVTISKYNASDSDALTPSKILVFFNTGYNYAWDILQNIRGRQIQYVKLTPTNSKSNIKEVLLGIDIKTKNIYNKIEVNKDGSKTILTINSFKTNQALSKNHFNFTESKYANYYINKLD